MKISFASFIMKTFLLWSVFVWLTVAGLSLVHQLHSTSVWAVFIIFCVGIGISIYKEQIYFNISWRPLTVIIFTLFALAFLQGVVSAPNTTDSMVYHLPRVMYWIQNKSIFMDVKVTSHDFMPGFAESEVLFFLLLTGNDRLAFLPQWLAGLALIATTVLTARELQLSRKKTEIAVLSVASIPILCLEAVSTQTDLVLAAFLSMAVYFALSFARKEHYSDLLALVISTAIGVVTKQIFLVFALIPFFLILPTFVTYAKKNLIGVFVTIVVGVSISFPYLWSNMHLYGSILGRHETSTGEVYIYTNEGMSPSLFMSNVVRNVMLHVPIPFFGNQIEAIISDDARTTWYGSTFQVQRIFIPQEDIAGAPIQLFLIVVALFFVSSKDTHPTNKKVFFLTLVAFFVFCLVMKWQPYHARLHLALIAVLMPAVISILGRYQKSLQVVVGFSLILAFTSVVANTSHPFFSYDILFSKLKGFAPAGQVPPQSIFTSPRSEQYYSARPYWKEPYRRMALEVKKRNIQTVSLSTFDEFTYPMMVELQKVGISVVARDGQVQIYSRSSNDLEMTVDTCFFTPIQYGGVCIESGRGTSLSML